MSQHAAVMRILQAIETEFAYGLYIATIDTPDGVSGILVSYATPGEYSKWTTQHVDYQEPISEVLYLLWQLSLSVSRQAEQRNAEHLRKEDKTND